MLESLHIRNYILIDSLDISFPEGLIIITGQTGAGKSILMGALSLLSGAKADASVIFEGAENCVIEAEFISDDPALKQILNEEDIEADGDRITIRRLLTLNGRSRSFVNDCPVQLAVLQRISSLLVDIHSQHAALSLARKDFQLSSLDFFAGNAQSLSECRDNYSKLQTCRSELAALRAKLSRLEADKEYNAAQFKQLNDARLLSGELEQIEEEHKSLANAEQIKEALSLSIELLSSDSQGSSVCSSLKEAARKLSQITSVYSPVASISERMEELKIEANDLLSELESLNDKIDMSPSRLEAVEDRMSLLYSLLKKFNCSTIDELITLRDSLSEGLSDSSIIEDKILELEKEEKQLQSNWGRICDKLSEARRKAAPEFASEITSSLRFLELERSKFEVDIESCEGSEKGADKVSFLFASDGRNPQELSKVASGGELSRIMLCLKALMARYTGMPTMIFDEIDTGVSGSAADKMGKMVCDMGRNMQVFSITHLPQVAAKGNAHYLVSKHTDSSDCTTSSIRRVEGEERVKEIARLLSAESITEASLANARELINESR